MNNVIQLNITNSIIESLEQSVDKSSTKKTLAFKYFNNSIDDLDSYLKNLNVSDFESNVYQEPVKQLEFSF
ncbi:MAG: hypothetical protein CBE38_02425 [Gammaproteobacteria bacterium TMED278]|nr:hypothetical protein [Gammaproteobacteria bacterium]OUX42543.1 MAG: hypothetical protein CBE38_02425 [Gammaproteobacteria bacterium TMED278]